MSEDCEETSAPTTVIDGPPIIFLSGMIDGPLADNVCAELLRLAYEHVDLDRVAEVAQGGDPISLPQRPPIYLRINCEGGEVAAAFAIVSTIREVQGMGVPVVATVVGHAASMAIPILAVCSKRRIAREAFVLIHGICWSFDHANQNAIFDDAIRLRDIHDAILVDLLGHHSKRPSKFWAHLMDDRREHYYDAFEVADLGLVDDVV